MIHAFFAATLLYPLVGALAIAIFGRGSEAVSAGIARVTTVIGTAFSLSLLTAWLSLGATSLQADLGGIGLGGDRTLPLSFLLDGTGAVFLLVTTLASAMVVRYSVVYLHREEGFTRFFSTIYTFLFGMHLVLLAGSLDLLFAGWEIVGIASFLLIGFYGDRELPVRASLRAYAVYRFCDLGLLLGVCLTHFVWRSGLMFQHMEVLDAHASAQWLTGFGLLMLVAACGKSAQFPFSFWLPRAMEGPTPSSAIFYGALSIHVGIFLLLRTSPLWEGSLTARIAIAAVGLLSALVATTSGRAQSNIKGQIAYASITQVGLMLVEVALGLHKLALLHFVGNAFLRCFQLLVSPSILANMLRMRPGPMAPRRSRMAALSPRLAASLYALSFNEWYLEAAIRSLLLRPLRGLGSLLQVKALRAVGALLAIAVLAAVLLRLDDPVTRDLGAAVLATLMLACSVHAVASVGAPERSWNAAAASCFLSGAAVFAASGLESSHDVSVYLLGTVPPWLLGLAVIRIRSGAGNSRIRLSEARAGLLLLFAFLALSGFPIGPAFIGEDHLLHRSVEHHQWLTVMLAVAFVLNGFTLAAAFSQVARGPRRNQSNAVKSSEAPGLRPAPAGELLRKYSKVTPGEAMNSGVMK